ncbi:MAG: hypothetical protein AAF081_05525 [Actinomycetota bacterium]
MGDVLRLDLAGADALLSAFGSVAETIDTDAAVVDRTLGGIDHLVDPSVVADAGMVPVRLLALGRLLRTEADDLRWRVAYVRARSASGLAIAAPSRDPRNACRPLSRLLADLTGDDRSAALHELAIRISLDPSLAATVATRLGADGIDHLNALVTHDAEQFWYGHASRLHDLPTGVTADDYAARGRQGLLDATADLGVVLAAMSHTSVGREALREAWGLTDGGVAVVPMSLALLHGVWDTDMLMAIADDVFAPSPIRWSFDMAQVRWRGSWAAVPELHPPHGAVLAAIGRSPEATFTFLVERDGYALVTDPDQHWGWPDVSGGDAILDGHLADLVRTAMLDPARADVVAAALIHGPGGGTPIFETIGVHGVPGPHTAAAWAEVVNAQWPRLTGRDPEIIGDPHDIGPALASIFQASEEAMAHVVAGFGVYVEASYVEGFAHDRVTEARAFGVEGFRSLDAALDELAERGHETDGHVFRDAFASLLGLGAQAVSNTFRLAGPLGWLFGFVADRFVEGVAGSLFSVEPETVPDSKDLLEALFLPGQSPPGSGGIPPAPIDVGIVNAAFAAFPERRDALGSSPWIVDGVVFVPTEDPDLTEFSNWLRQTVKGDDFFGPLVRDEARALAHDADTHTG